MLYLPVLQVHTLLQALCLSKDYGYLPPLLLFSNLYIYIRSYVGESYSFIDLQSQFEVPSLKTGFRRSFKV